MELLHRRILFYASFLIFLILSTGAILYALGYTYDFEDGRIIKSGSLQIRVQTGMNVYINGEFEDSFSAFSNSFSKSRIIPKKYEVVLKKEGFNDWKKNVEIKAGYLSSFPSAFVVTKTPTLEVAKDLVVAKKSLAPEDIKDEEEITFVSDLLFVPKDSVKKIVKRKDLIFTLVGNDGEQLFYVINGDNPDLIASKVIDFSVDTKEEKVAWFTKHEVWTSWLDDTSYQPLKNANDRELINRTTAEIKDISWFSGDNHLFVLYGNSQIDFMEIDGRGGRNIYTILNSPDNKIKNIAYNQDNKLLFIESVDNIYSINLFK